MTIGKSLKRFRTERGITQKHLANAIGINYQDYQRYEYDKVVPTTTVMIKIADTFDTSIDYLVGRSDNPQRA